MMQTRNHRVAYDEAQRKDRAHDDGPDRTGDHHPAEIDLRPGGRITFDHGPHGRLPAVIVVVEPPHRFCYRWAADDLSDREPAEGDTTLVEFTLTPGGDGTRLRVVESGSDQVIMEPARLKARYEADSDGWGRAIAGLAEYAEQ